MQPGYELAGRYVLEELLGQGAVGEVWRAKDRELDRTVAVKVIRERIADPKLARGFLGEARIAGRLQHAGITVVHDVGEDGGQPFIVMELLHGRDLDTVLRGHPGGMPAGQVVLLAIQFADALATAHAGGVVHRDLKPANLFLQDNGQLKICDFGIAVATDATSLPASFSYVVGTPAYMSPEQCDGQQAGESADLYSLGCVLYALLTGRPPFTGGPPLAVMSQHRTVTPAAPRALRPAVPAGLDQLVVDLLAKDPAARPENARQVADALRALRERPGAVEATPPQAPPRRTPARSGQAATPAKPRRTRPPADLARQFPAVRQHAAVLRAHFRAINGMCSVTVGGRQLLATASSDHTARLWDPATRQQTATFEGHEHEVNAICRVTIGDQQLLATASSDHTARLWDPATRQHAATFEGHEHEVNAICPVTIGDRQLLATASNDHTARVWDPVTRRQIAVLLAHTKAVNALCPVAAGRRQLLATASSDHTVELWDPAINWWATVPLWHTSAIIEAVCPVIVGDRQLLATGSSDGTVRLWKLAKGQSATVIEGSQPESG